MSMQWNSVALDSLGVLRARGADVLAFLQGQLSNDVTLLNAESSLLAGYHNPQGRAIALLRLVELAPGDVLALLPRELVASVAARLAKFILRSKVKLADESAQWAIDGVLAAEGAADASVAHAGLVPAAAGAVRRLGATHIVRPSAAASRLLFVRPADSDAPAGVGPLSPERWALSAIAAGEPQVYAATSEEFVAQMLNLDLLQAIAFGKGCYTGQEVIARAHYRGRVKRRMQRFLAARGTALRPGDAGVLRDRRPFKVVEAAQHPDGSCEFLAVATTAPEPAAAALTEAATATSVEARELPLPYALPQ